MRFVISALAMTTALVSVADAATVYPLDRATILSGSPFDLKIEFDTIIAAGSATVTINGESVAKLLGKDLQFIEKEDGVNASAMLLRSGSISKPGVYKLEARAGNETKTVTWEVYGTAAQPRVKNIIFLLGDGLSVSHRTAARLMSKGMTEGKANGRLAMDDLDVMAFVGTSATNSVSTDSANTMSAYMTGHKTAVNALGVYADRTNSSLDDPRVETMGEALRRTTKKSIGVVTNTEVQDATPAAVVSHTRLRSDKAEIVSMFFDVKPDVVMGGGSAYFLPQSTPGSKRKDNTDYIAMFKGAGYTLATSKDELKAAAGTNTGKILGLFHPSNMDATLDREFLKKGTVSKLPNQPGLVEMAGAALNQLSKNPDGFFLMIEGGNIDKMSHSMDWERAIIDTIEFDKVVALARDFAKTDPDTLVIVTGDHTHGLSVIGTIDDTKPGTDMREKVGIYAAAGFPNYEDKDGDGYPDRVDVTRRLAMFANNYPDYYETFRPKLGGPFEPAVQNEKREFVANEAFKDAPGAILRVGNIPKSADTAVHTVDDVVLQASGPGSERFKGYLEQSDVYRIMVDLFALAADRK